ncbi:MAG: ATP-grasp domain-containing protein [Ignavibacteriae bacterium]|nr:ATP-grasp domain-containing protein [Ignavibacteriota bacterium]
MKRKTRIAILYNEPVVGTEAGRKYISENGQLQEGPPVPAIERKASNIPFGVDLSEIGVVEEMDDIKEALTSLGYKCSVFNVDSKVDRLIEFLREDKPDLIFNLVECIENESILEMNVAGMYELFKIPYTGAGPLALGTALNKPRVKEIMQANGIRTPQHQVFKVAEKIVLRDGMEFPLIVKPSHEDASVGISDKSVVYSLNELRRQVRYIWAEFDQPALVEQFIDGRELNVAVIGNHRPIVLPISEIEFSGLNPGMHKIVSYAAKWLNGTVEYEGTKGVCPAQLPAAIETEVRDTALQCYKLIGCRDYARVDFRLSASGVPYVLEINPNPDISDEAGFARSAKAYGLTFPQIIGKIVESALERVE